MTPLRNHDSLKWRFYVGYMIRQNNLREGILTLLFLSNQNGALKLSILNWAEGNESSSFDSEIKRISVFLPTVFFKGSTLFLNELIFKWFKMNFPGQFLLQWFCYKNHIHKNYLSAFQNNWSFCSHMEVFLPLLVCYDTLNNLPNKIQKKPQHCYLGNYLLH